MPSGEKGTVWPVLTGRHLIWANAVWPAFFIPLTFLLYFLVDDYELDEIRGVKQIPTISSSGALTPYSVLLTYGLHLQAVLIALLFTCIYVKYKRIIQQWPGMVVRKEEHGDSKNNEQLDQPHNVTVLRCMELSSCGCCCSCSCGCWLSRTPTTREQLQAWNFYTFCCGMTASFLMSLVGSITLDINEIAHSTFAFFMFLAGILHMYFFYFKITKVLFADLITNTTQPKQLDDGQKRRLWRVYLHQFCIFLSFPFNILMYVLAGIVFVTCSDITCQRFSVDLLPSTEFSTVIALLLYITQFYDDVKDVNVLAMDTQQSPLHSTDSASNPVFDPHLEHEEKDEVIFSQENISRQHVVHEV